MEDNSNIIIGRLRPFRETYTMITFALCVGMIYPNPNTEKWRLVAVPLIIASTVPLAGAILIDIYFSWMERDIVNIIRHTTIIGPFMAGFLKMILMFYKRVTAKQILDEIDGDYEKYNHLTHEFRQLATRSVYNSRIYCERTWVIIVLAVVLVFPLMAVVLTMYNFLFKSVPTKYMIHDLNKPFAEKEARFESPFFEVVFVYELYCSFFYAINFIGYDGFFGLCINHACLKIDLYCKALEEAMSGPQHLVQQGIVAVIREQNKMFQFVEWIQDTFNIWLGLIFIATMIQIGTCFYLSTEGTGFDLRHTLVVLGSIIHIYLPCRYAAKLKAMSAESAIKVYCCGWERVPSQTIRKMIVFMIARGQVPLEITAFNMLAFDMDLFVSMMQTSYSMFTLLRS